MSITFSPLLETSKDRLQVRVYSDRKALGEAAAAEAVAKIRELLERHEGLRIVFAAAPSQNEFLEALVRAEGIDWPRITAFHMDDYIGLRADAPQRFSHFLNTRLFDLVRPGVVHLIDSTAPAEADCRRYEQLLQAAPIDIVCLGIGENGHIAFNDPPVADFRDSRWIKPVELDEACRRQQVNDGCFPSLADVPSRALTLTIPALMSGKHLYCMVPGPSKRLAVERTLNGPISTDCPATILREHRDCTLYVDTDSYGQV
jgi:glucosamine-6-phosphate deaminase